MYTRPGTRRGGAFSGTQGSRKAPLTALLIVFIIISTVMTFLFLRSVRYKNNVELQFRRQVVNAVVDAIDNVNRLTTGVQSDSANKLSLVRQNVHLIDKVNEFSKSLGGNAYVDEEAVQVLYDDIISYEKLLATGTSSTLEARDALLTHLTAVHAFLRDLN
ncbi:MAG: hypothetical protein Q4E07_02135 [Eubacteriales bacterium]|nr:hypothetical protein [Eubacteriales bacterium]